MKSVLELRLTNTEGVLERVLGRLRQRGFDMCSMNCERSEDKSIMTMRMTVESARSIENVCKQLEKLYDVQSVILFYSEANEKHNGKSEQLKVCLSV